MPLLDRFRRRNSRPVKGSAPGLIGLDVGERQIHLCQIRPRPHGQFAICAKDSLDYDGDRKTLLASPKQLKSLILPALRRKNFHGRKVAALMPWDQVRILLLTYKASVSDVDAEVLRMLAGRVDGSLDDYVIDYVPVRANPGDEEHMVVATLAQRAQVDEMLHALIACGLEVDSLDVAPTALRRLVSALYSGHAADNVLMINTYPHQSYLTVISGRRLLFNQSVDFGEARLLAQVAKALDIEPDAARSLVLEHGLEKAPLALAVGAEDVSSTLLEIVKPCFLDLVEEINRVLVFTAAETHGVPFSRVCLLGSIAHWPGAQKVLLSLLDFDAPDGLVEFTQIFQDENDDTRISWAGMFSEISIAMGLALRGLVEHE